MAGRLSALRIVDPVLTNYAWGYRNGLFIAQVLFPFVPVEKEAGKYPVFGKEAFKEYNTLRAPRADSNVMVPEDASTGEFVCNEHDIGYPLDVREKREATFDEEKRGTRIVSDIIGMKHEIDCAALAQTAGNYPSGHKVTLSGTDQFTHADSDPITTIETGKEAIRAAIGVYPNVMEMGASVYKVLKNHSKLLERIKYSMKGVLTIELMQEIFGIPKIVVGGAVKSSDAGSFSDIWSDNVVLSYVPQEQENQDMGQPSFGWTFRVRGYPQIDMYLKEGNKTKVVRSTDIFIPQIVGSSAGYLISDTNA